MFQALRATQSLKQLLNSALVMWKQPWVILWTGVWLCASETFLQKRGAGGIWPPGHSLLPALESESSVSSSGFFEAVALL